MRISKVQKKAFFIGLPIIIFFIILHILIPNSVFVAHIIMIIMIWLFTLFASRDKATLNYNSFEYKPKAKDLLGKGVCPFCEKNPISEYKIGIGYTKARFWMKYYVFFIRYSYNRDEFKTFVPLCNQCKDRFLQKRLSNPSYFILEGKKGFSKGLKFPYDKGHIFKPDNVYKN